MALSMKQIPLPLLQKKYLLAPSLFEMIYSHDEDVVSRCSPFLLPLNKCSFQKENDSNKTYTEEHRNNNRNEYTRCFVRGGCQCDENTDTSLRTKPFRNDCSHHTVSCCNFQTRHNR